MTPLAVEPTRAARSIVRAEFCEMPGLRLTLTQARRLFDLSRDECREVLDALVAEGFLQRAGSGQYARADRQIRSR